MSHEEENLGKPAMRFRGSRNTEERRAIASDYSQAVVRLIRAGNWHAMPTTEDQLPDDWMPKDFFEYWSSLS